MKAEAEDKPAEKIINSLVNVQVNLSVGDDGAGADTDADACLCLLMQTPLDCSKGLKLAKRLKDLHLFGTCIDRAQGGTLEDSWIYDGNGHRSDSPVVARSQ